MKIGARHRAVHSFPPGTVTIDDGWRPSHEQNAKCFRSWLDMLTFPDAIAVLVEGSFSSGSRSIMVCDFTQILTARWNHIFAENAHFMASYCQVGTLAGSIILPEVQTGRYNIAASQRLVSSIPF